MPRKALGITIPQNTKAQEVNITFHPSGALTIQAPSLALLETRLRQLRGETAIAARKAAQPATGDIPAMQGAAIKGTRGRKPKPKTMTAGGSTT